MPIKSNKSDESVRSSNRSDLRDDRQGAYDPVANEKKPDDSEPSEQERAQSGGTMQGEPIPAENFEIPEGLKRQPAGPYSRDKGRSDKVPEHVPQTPKRR